MAACLRYGYRRVNVLHGGAANDIESGALNARYDCQVRQPAVPRVKKRIQNKKAKTVAQRFVSFASIEDELRKDVKGARYARLSPVPMFPGRRLRRRDIGCRCTNMRQAAADRQRSMMNSLKGFLCRAVIFAPSAECFFGRRPLP